MLTEPWFSRLLEVGEGGFRWVFFGSTLGVGRRYAEGSRGRCGRGAADVASSRVDMGGGKGFSQVQHV